MIWNHSKHCHWSRWKIKCLHFFGNRAQLNCSSVNFNIHNSVLCRDCAQFARFCYHGNRRAISCRLKTWNENLGDRKDNQKNFPSSTNCKSKNQKDGICVTGIGRRGLSAGTTNSLIFAQLSSSASIPSLGMLKVFCNSFTFSSCLPSSYSWYQSPSQMESIAQGYLFVIDIIVFLSRHDHICSSFQTFVGSLLATK